jgi:hypothetical protein
MTVLHFFAPEGLCDYPSLSSVAVFNNGMMLAVNHSKYHEEVSCGGYKVTVNGMICIGSYPF